jgi:hypothetical protein
MDIDFERSLRKTLQAIIADAASAQIVEALHDLGWWELVAETPTALALLYDELGKAARSTALIDQLAITQIAPEVADCDVIVYPTPFGDSRPPGRLTDDEIFLDGCALKEPGPDDRVVFGAAAGPGESLAIVVIPGLKAAHEFEAQQLDGLDTDGSWVRIRARMLRNKVEAGGRPDSGVWSGVLTAARRAAATELTGLSRGAIELAVAHVSTRSQFGRTIGSFQAVRHHLADAHVLTTGADALLDNAWRDPIAETTDLAFAYAGRAHRAVMSHCLQVCGAMGLSWEHDLHRYVRRGFALDTFFGPSNRVTDHLGGRHFAVCRSVAQGGDER